MQELKQEVQQSVERPQKILILQENKTIIIITLTDIIRKLSGNGLRFITTPEKVNAQKLNEFGI